MGRLILFELNKIWKKRSTLAAMALLLCLHIFLLWYTNLSDGNRPALSAYKAVQADLNKMTESQKQTYIETLYQDIQNIGVVRDILMLQAGNSDMGKQFAEQERAEHPGVFEAYYSSYINESYLKYTDSYEQEEALITELYEEITKVSSYSDYLNRVQKQKDNLFGISIFADSEQDNFSSRNIKKSAMDYHGLETVRITFYPSKGIMSAMGNSITDILLLLAVLLLSGSLIYEEKEKGLFHVTRASLLGRGHNIGAKLLALGISIFFLTILAYGTNILYFAGTVGIGDGFRSIQSVAPLMESSLPINVLAYCLLSILTKVWILFFTGTLITLVSILSKHSFMPYLICTGILVVSLILYRYIPAYSSFHWLKYLNVIGLLNTSQIYGGYMNFNLGGYPVSRCTASLIALFLYVFLGITATIYAFLKCRSWELQKLRLPVLIPFHPHASLLRHEGYKLLVMNRAGIVFLIIAVCIGYQTFSIQYHPSPAEVYYQSLMLQLEGELTADKEKLIHEEQKRYEAAFEQIDRIDRMVASGTISAAAGDSMKLSYYNETAFYPAFQRVLTQYNNITETGGRFIYDTGYLYLFGLQDNTLLINLLLLISGILFAFSNGLSMEYQKKSWCLLSATLHGKRSIYIHKTIICLGYTALLSLVPWICRLIHINDTYPLRGLFTSLQSIPAYHETGFTIPVILWILLVLLIQTISMLTVTLVTLCLSDRLRQHIPAFAAGTVLLILPLLLNAMGFDFAYWFSFLPIYRIPCLVIETYGGMIGMGYLIGSVCIGLFAMFFMERSCMGKG